MRILELDYIKGVMIILVITFHLVYFEQLYPYAKQVVYTFHMPVFLLISGYLMNISKHWKSYLNGLLGLVIPYIVMESGYIIMASILPIHEHIDHLTVTVFFNKLFIHPLGPYWYLHSIIICGITYYGVFCCFKVKNVTRFLLIGLLYYFYSHILGILAFSSGIYFLAGSVLRQCNVRFTGIFQSSLLAILAFVFLIFQPEYLDRSTLGGVLIVYLAISSCIFAFKYSHTQIRSMLVYCGRNSLLLYVFSPLFTILCKQMVPYLKFDPTGFIFLVLSLAICISGTLFIGYLMDKLRLSPLFFRKDRILSQFVKC